MCVLVLVIMSKAGHTPPSTYVVADTRTETAPDERKLSHIRFSVSGPAAAAGAGARSRAAGDGARARRVRGSYYVQGGVCVIYIIPTAMLGHR